MCVCVRARVQMQDELTQARSTVEDDVVRLKEERDQADRELQQVTSERDTLREHFKVSRYLHSTSLSLSILHLQCLLLTFLLMTCSVVGRGGAVYSINPVVLKPFKLSLACIWPCVPITISESVQMYTVSYGPIRVHLVPNCQNVLAGRDCRSAIWGSPGPTLRATGLTT